MLFYDSGHNEYKTTDSTFATDFGHLRFDEILRYVSFRNGELKFNEKHSFIDEKLRGRQDMVYFFEWLHQKGVRRVLTVIVDDIKNPHSDEAIEKSLKNLKVEVLDWQKLDLCPQTIQRVGGDLKELHLHWSGSNAALRGWSGPDGLRKITTLDVVHLHIRQVRSSLWSFGLSEKRG